MGRAHQTPLRIGRNDEPTANEASLAVTLAFSALLWCCFSDRPTAPPIGDPTFASDIQPVLSSNCASSGCHGINANPVQKPMVLLAGEAYDNVVGVPSWEPLRHPSIRFRLG